MWMLDIIDLSTKYGIFCYLCHSIKICKDGINTFNGTQFTLNFYKWYFSNIVKLLRALWIRYGIFLISWFLCSANMLSSWFFVYHFKVYVNIYIQLEISTNSLAFQFFEPSRNTICNQSISIALIYYDLICE